VCACNTLILRSAATEYITFNSGRWYIATSLDDTSSYYAWIDALDGESIADTTGVWQVSNLVIHFQHNPPLMLAHLLDMQVWTGSRMESDAAMTAICGA